MRMLSAKRHSHALLLAVWPSGWQSLTTQIEAPKREIGTVDDAATIEPMRNKGGNRTPKKRAFLSRIEGRVKAAGKTPVRAYY